MFSPMLQLAVFARYFVDVLNQVVDESQKTSVRPVCREGVVVLRKCTQPTVKLPKKRQPAIAYNSAFNLA